MRKRAGSSPDVVVDLTHARARSSMAKSTFSSLHLASLLGGLVIVVALAVGSYLWLSEKKAPKYTGPIEKITLAVSSSSVSALIYVAEDLGYFEENGLDVMFKEYPSGKQCADAMIAGEADISTSADFVLVSNSFDHDDLRVLGTVSSLDIIELIARKDRGINQLRDLKGKKVGVLRKSVAEFFLGVLATFNGFSIDDILIVDLTPPQNVTAMSRGDIDASLVWNPFAYEIKSALGDNAISWSGQSNQDYYFLLLTKESWIKKNPEVAERFLQSLIRAEEYMIKNNDAAKTLLREAFDYDVDYLNAIWTKMDFRVILSQELLLLFEDQARWRVDNNLTKGRSAPNYLDFLSLEALESVKPEAVTVIR